MRKEASGSCVSGMITVAVVVSLSFAVLLIDTSSASAEFVGDLVIVEATSSAGSGSMVVPMGPDPGSFVGWSLAQPFEVRSTQGDLLGTVDELTVELDGDPMVNLAFAATAGGADTTFTITSATVSFFPRANPTGTATSSVTLTDTAVDGATIDPLAPNSGLFEAVYNGSSVFAELVGSQSLFSGGTLTASENAGPSLIPGTVSSIQASFGFKLSANDTASGTGVFEIEGPLVPEPSTFALLGMGAVGLLVGAWRRRRGA